MDGHLAVVRLLCGAGADKNQATRHGSAALCVASGRGHLEVVRFLCNAGAHNN